MKVSQTLSDYTLPEQIQTLLNNHRSRRNFSPEEYVFYKATLINNYLSKSRLSGCVVAVSGGVDSAVVLALLSYAKSLKNSPIEVIAPILLPAYNNTGVSNQIDATTKGINLCKHYNIKPYIIDIEHSVNSIRYSVENAFNSLNTSDWAVGQLVPYTRTPTLYYTATLLTDNGYPSLIVGTTNRDEGSYLGYIGKASDGMVDLQVISDLHKSEVYQVAKYLGVPEDILNATPRGDMFDNKSDIDIFGASYDFVEFYTTTDTRSISESFFKSGEDYQKYATFSTNLENLHRYNQHKYFSGSPAVHLDILESGVQGGYKLDFSNDYYSYLNKFKNNVYGNFVAKIDNKAVENELAYFELAANDTQYYSNAILSKNDEVILIDYAITENECNMLLDIFQQHVSESIQANVYGYRESLDTNHNGSKRLTLYSVELSKLIYKRILPFVPKVVCGNTHNNLTVTDQNALYKCVGVNPSFRYIAYENNGMLVPHYDYPFEDKIYDGITLYTVVLYLTDNSSGATRFFKDDNSSIPWNSRNIADMSYEDSIEFNKNLTVDSIECYNLPKKCTIAIFPHGKLHDCSEVIGEQKIIMRTDIMYSKINFSGS